MQYSSDRSKVLHIHAESTDHAKLKIDVGHKWLFITHTQNQNTTSQDGGDILMEIKVTDSQNLF